MNTENANLVKDRWHAYLAFIDESIKARALFHHNTRSVLSLEMDQFGFEGFEKVIKETATGIRSAMIKAAVQQFSPIASAPVQISVYDVDELFPVKFKEPTDYERRQGEKRNKPENFDPAALWKHLEETYGGDAAEDNAFGEVAKNIINLFRLDWERTEIKSASGRTVMSRSVYLDDFEKKHHNKNVLNYSCASEMSNLCHQLSTFLKWAGEISAAIELEKFGNDAFMASREDRSIVSRCKFDIDSHIQIVTFNTRFEFRFNPEIAEQLQIFLGQYAPGMIKAKAA